MSDGPVKVVYVEDNREVAESVSLLIKSDPRLQWVRWMPCTDGLLEGLSKLQPDIVLLDLDIPGSDTLEAIRAMRAARASSRVLIFSGQVSQLGIDAAVEAGAWGYVCKIDGNATLITALLDVAKGVFVLSPTARRVYDQA